MVCRNMSAVRHIDYAYTFGIVLVAEMNPFDKDV